MSQDLKDTAGTLLAKNRKAIDRNVRTLLGEVEREKTTAKPATLTAQFDRLLNAYRRIKPLLAFVTTFPLIPGAWRLALQVFMQQLDALTLAGPEIRAQFKAGRDL